MTAQLKSLMAVATGAFIMTGCSAGHHANESHALPEHPRAIAIGSVNHGAIEASAPRALPKAILYKMSGDYRDNLPVQLGADGSLLCYPDPADIPADARPLMLDRGWMISPVGIGARSVFTRYTYSEYRALRSAPAPDDILKAVIPGAKVTATMEVPFTLSEALADTSAVNRFISSTGPLRIK